MNKLIKVLVRMNLRIPKSYVQQLPKSKMNTRKFTRSSKRLWAVLPLTMQHLQSGQREARKVETPLKIIKAAMTLTQMILRLEKKGPCASITKETSALLSSKIRAGLTFWLLTENDSSELKFIHHNLWLSFDYE